MQDTMFRVRLVLYQAIIRKYDRGVQLRYNYRLYPTRGQRRRWRGRSGARGSCSTTRCASANRRMKAGLPYVTDADLSARLTAAKATPDRAWLTGVSSVVLQQALADLNAA